MNTTTPSLADAEQKAALSSIQELLASHFHEAVDAADEDGKFSIGFRVIFDRSASPTKLTVVSRISKSVSDEIKTTVADPMQPDLL